MAIPGNAVGTSGANAIETGMEWHRKTHKINMSYSGTTNEISLSVPCLACALHSVLHAQATHATLAFSGLVQKNNVSAAAKNHFHRCITKGALLHPPKGTTTAQPCFDRSTLTPHTYSLTYVED